MKFHPPSFALGVGTAVLLMGKKQHLRPVVVEIAALGLHLGKLGLGLIERQREHVEDLFAEVTERVPAAAGGARGERAARKTNGASGLHGELLVATSPPVLVVHALGRRVRLRAPALAGHRRVCERIAKQLAADPARGRPRSVR